MLFCPFTTSAAPTGLACSPHFCAGKYLGTMKEIPYSLNIALLARMPEDIASKRLQYHWGQKCKARENENGMALCLALLHPFRELEKTSSWARYPDVRSGKKLVFLKKLSPKYAQNNPLEIDAVYLQMPYTSLLL